MAPIRLDSSAGKPDSGLPIHTLSTQSPVQTTVTGEPTIAKVQRANHIVPGVTSFVMGPEPLGLSLYRAFGVPWKQGDIHERLKNITVAESVAQCGSSLRRSHPRWNGSMYYPVKVPHLIGFKDRKYIDHTATHLHRYVGDLMRYAALVSFAEAADFGPYHLADGETRRVGSRLPDEALYALALYIYSLQPPPNPNKFDEKAQAGQKIFTCEGCPACHTPPLYTIPPVRVPGCKAL